MSNVSSANQHTNDEREQRCWDFYVESIQKGQENAYASAVKAGYSTDHAENITLQGWFKERKDKLRRKGMFSKAERNLDRILDIDYEKDDEIDSSVLKIVADVSKNIASTLGKDEGYSSRTEMTGAGGGAIKHQGIPDDEFNSILTAYATKPGKESSSP